MCILVGMCILLMSHMVQSLNLFISKLNTVPIPVHLENSKHARANAIIKLNTNQTIICFLNSK